MLSFTVPRAAAPTRVWLVAGCTAPRASEVGALWSDPKTRIQAQLLHQGAPRSQGEMRGEGEISGEAQTANRR